MRIGIDFTAAVRQSAGIGRYTRLLIAALAQIDRENKYVLLSAGRQPAGTLWPANFGRRELPLTDRHLAILWQRLRLPVPVEWLTGSLDLFHSPDFVLPPVRRAKTVLTVHDLSFMRHPECSSPDLLDYLMSTVPRSVARADMILADSESTRLDLIELLQVPADRVRVIYAGVEERFVPQEDERLVESVLQRYGIRRPYILGLGTLQPRKNFPRLIEAFARLKQQQRIPHRLVIGGGKGWLYDAIYAAVTRCGLEQDVQLVGFVNDEDLPALYSAATVFAFPSLYEGFGIPVLEAMGCGTPVVTSNVSSLPEVAGDAALQVAPDDVAALANSLWRLIDDSRLRATLRERGHRQVLKFTWHRSAEQLLQVYGDVGCNGGGR